MKNNFDYIIVGAGSAGCVIANRLSANKNNQVLLLEAGGKAYNPWLHIPVGYFKTINNPKFDWMYRIEPDIGLNNRNIQWPRGKVLGGSSALNGLLYVRGDKQDYDNWEAMGNKGWSYKDCLPYFIKSEKHEDGASKYHGDSGELHVSHLRLRRQIADDCIKAAKAVGIPFNKDYNGEQQEGIGYFQQTAYKGLRQSTATAFLKPIRNRSNLVVLTRAQTEKVLFKDKNAIGVSYYHNNQKKQVFANKEVILASGAICSPQILQLSGIGDKQLLQSLNIDVIHNNKAVGKNLQDHLQTRLIYKTSRQTLNDELNSWYNKMLVGLEYALFRTGALTLCASQVYAFFNTKLDGSRPNIQYHIQPFSADKPGDGVHNFSAFTISVCVLRPESRGEVKICANDICQAPKIIANYLSTKGDCQTAIDAIKVTRKIINTSPLKEVILEEFVPGANYQSDDEILDAAREYSQTIYHPTSTCKMGCDDDSVVDDRLRVIGVKNLRVIDASIMPQIVSGNTNAPTIMIAEKGSDMILADNK